MWVCFWMKQVISCQWTHRRGCFGLPKGTKSSGTPGLFNNKEKPEQGRITLGEERKHLNKLNIHNESCKNWLISSQGHSSSRRARTKSWGTTGQSTSPQSPRRWWKSVWKPFSKKKVIGSHKHRILKGKSCLTSVMAFHNETASWWMREEKLLLSTWISVKFLTLSHCHHHRTTDKLKVRRVKSEMNWKLSK